MAYEEQFGPQEGAWNPLDPRTSLGMQTPKFSTRPLMPASPAVAQVGGSTGGNPSGQPSEQDKMMMEYMLKMGEFTPQEKAMERKAAMGDQLRADAGDGSGIMDAGRLKPFSLAKGLGDMANKVAGGYLKGKAGRESDAIGGNKSNAMKGLAKKMGFGGTSGAEDFSKGWNAENYG